MDEKPDVPSTVRPKPRLGARALAALALAAGALTIACVSAPFAALARRNVHAAAAPPVHHEAAVATASAAPADLDAGAPAETPPHPRVHTFRVADLAGDTRVHLAKGSVGKHPLLVALSAAGLGKKAGMAVVTAFKGVRDLDHCAPSDTFAFAKSVADGHLVAFEFATSREDVWQTREADGALEKAHKLELDIEHHQVAVGLVVQADLRTAISHAKLDEGLLSMLDDALDGHADLSDLKPGVRLRIVATEERVEGRFTGYSSLDAVEYTAVGHDPLRIYWYARGSSDPHGSHHGPGGYYDAKGRQPYHGGWRSPVPMARISSRFDPHRMHPVLHVIMPHNGVDFAAPSGTPVYAAASGKVVVMSRSGPCGNMIKIDHPNGLTSAYCHLSRFAGGLHVGEHVETRQLIGYVGQTGRATGPHLHFAVKRGAVFLDPLAMKLDGVRVLPPAARDDFEHLREAMDKALDAIPLPESPDAGEADAGEVFYEDPSP